MHFVQHVHAEDGAGFPETGAAAGCSLPEGNGNEPGSLEEQLVIFLFVFVFRFPFVLVIGSGFFGREVLSRQYFPV